MTPRLLGPAAAGCDPEGVTTDVAGPKTASPLPWSPSAGRARRRESAPSRADAAKRKLRLKTAFGAHDSDTIYVGHNTWSLFGVYLNDLMGWDSTNEKI